MPVNVLALAYDITAMIDMCWPRTPDASWFDNYIVLVMTFIIVAIGFVYMVLAGYPYAHGDQPWADAIPKIGAKTISPAEPARGDATASH